MRRFRAHLGFAGGKIKLLGNRNFYYEYRQLMLPPNELCSQALVPEGPAPIVNQPWIKKKFTTKGLLLF